MKTLTTVLMSGCLALAASGAFAASHTEMKKMTMQECKDHMAMAKKDGMKKDDAMMKKDTMCADMMKTDAGMMKKDGMGASAPMKK